MTPPMPDASKLKELIAGFSGRRVLLIGDLVADHYIKGKSSRISREAPVLILKYQGETVVPGQVGNTAANIAALGGEACLVSLVGNDGMGEKLTAALREAGVKLEGVKVSETGSTLTKTRILAGGHHSARQQVIRIDDDDRMALSQADVESVLESMDKLAESVDAIVVSDYGYGVVNEQTWAKALEIARNMNVPVVLDSRYDLCRWKGASLITPNEEEAYAAGGFQQESCNGIEEVGQKVRELTGCKDLIITRGNEGMVLFPENGEQVALPIFGSDECTDVTGAGDTVVATATLSLASGASAVDAMVLSNLGGALVVMKMGTATITQQELLGAIGMIPYR